jgi:flagellar hook-length control protein FliK
MKVSADSPPPVPTQASTGDSKGSESKPFAKVLKEKAEADAGDTNEQDYFSFPRAKKPGEQIAAGDGVPVPQLLPVSTAAPVLSGGAPATDAAGQTAAIQSLVQEISVAAPPGGPQSVEVQFNSTTLEGLKVRVTSTDGDTTIRFSTSSQSVSQLISRNADQLSQALEAKGIQAGPIQVEWRPASVASSSSDGTPSRDNRRGQSDGRQQKQQK